MANTPVVIYFVGLIAHLSVGTSQKHQVAALVDASGHSAQIIVTATAVKTSTFAQIGTKPDSKGRNHYSLTGVGRVQIEGISGGAVLPKYSNAEFIRLDDLTRKTALKPTVEGEMSNAFAFVELHGGDLAVSGYYPTNWELDGNDIPCLASQISFTSQTSLPTIRFLSDDGHEMEVTVGGGTEVTIANLPTTAMSGHSKVYAELMLNGDQTAVKRFAVPPPEKLKACGKTIFMPSSLEVYKADTADCTDTHFP